MKNKLMALFSLVRQVGKVIELRIARSLQLQLGRVRNLAEDLAGTWTRCQAQTKAVVYFNMPAWLLRYMVKIATSSQAGFSTVSLLIGMFVVIMIVVLFVTKGVPQILTLSANMTSLTAAGATAEQAQWWTWGMWAVIMLIVIGVAGMLIKKYGHGVDGGGGGGGGGRRRRYRR